MAGTATKEVKQFMKGLVKRNPGEKEFHQAVQEVVETLMPYVLDHEDYQKAQILERMTEPDRIVIFRVTWEDDEGNVRANRAWRVQFNNSIGPYKGGMRFHPTVTLSVLKFLGFEQTFKNSLTGLPMGGGKGGSNFNPKGKSDREVMRFCQSLMIELLPPHRRGHRRPGRRHRRRRAARSATCSASTSGSENRFIGMLTGKGLSFGGSLVRTEATGYGCVYFCQNMLEPRGDSLEGKTAVVSGSGNVAIYTRREATELGAKVVTAVRLGRHHPRPRRHRRREARRGSRTSRRSAADASSEYAEKFGCEYHEGKRPWGVPCDVAFPCATQNELRRRRRARSCSRTAARSSARAPTCPRTSTRCTPSSTPRSSTAPAKAANAGGVARLGPRAEPECAAHLLEPRRGRHAPQGHHERHPRASA